MTFKNMKGKAMAAVAGAVVGAGAVIAGAVALSDEKNQKKIDNAMSKARGMVGKYSSEMKDKVERDKGKIRKFAGKAIKTAEKVTKVAKKGVQKI